MKEPIEVIFFDFGGTIADTRTSALLIFATLARYFRLDPKLIAEVRKSRELDLQQIVRDSAISRPVLLIMVSLAKILMFTRMISPIEGIVQALQKLDQWHYNLGILSSDSSYVIHKFLKKHDLHLFNKNLIKTDLIEKEKEFPALLEKLNLSPDCCLYIGDEARDIDAARAAGLAVIAVTWGFMSPHKLAQHKPDLIVDDPAMLPHAIRSFSQLKKGDL